jgi:5'-nucleotidase (lipoprotein e(P4) family)
MKKILLIAFVLLNVFLSSCKVKKEANVVVVHDTIYVTRYKPIFSNNDVLLMSVLWFQTAGEYRALMYQAYNAARAALDHALATHTDNRPLAVVFDIDETLLDNSPYEAKTILEGIHYPEKWNEWVSEAKAMALPGAVAFATYAAEKGVHLFYISNREEKEREATKRNLISQGFPFQGDDHLLLRENTSSKEARRQWVAKQYDIVLLIGDNLGDFDGIFDNKSCTERNKLVDEHQKLFGSRYIILPNPMYGDWEGCIYNYEYKISPAKRVSLQKTHLRSF